MAQTVVTELVIDSSRAVSGANEYTRAMDGAQSAMQRSLGAMSNIIPSITQIAVGVGAAAVAFAALSKVVQEFTHGLADMGQAARRAGLDVESFQKLQFAASLEGISNKDFASGVEKMAARLNDASRNENELSKLLDANNIKFKDANGTLISTNALLEKARDLISREPLEQNKRVIAEMLGLTKEWVPLLDKSAQAFADTQNEAKALGLVINADVIKKAEDFDREWRKSSTVFSTWVKAQLAELLPLLDDLIGKAGDFAASVKGSLDAAANSPAGQEFTARSNRAAAILEMLSLENSAKENADIVTGAAHAMAGTLSEATAKALDQQIAIKGLAKFWSDYAASMFDAAKASEAFLKVSAANSNGPPPIIPAKDTTESKDALDRAIESIKRQTEAWGANAQAAGLGTQAMEEYRVVANLVSAAERAGIDVTAELGQKFNDLAVAAGEQRNADEIAIALDKARFDAKTALLSPLEKEIALLQKRNGINQQTDEIVGLKRQTDAIKQADDAATQFATTLVDGLLDGKSLVDSLKSAFDGLAKSMANAAIKDLFSGNFEKAGIEAVIAVGAKLASNFFDNSQQKELEKAKLAFADMSDQVRNFNAAAAGFDLSQFVSAMQQIVKTGMDLIKAAVAAGDTAAAVQLIVSGVKQINNQVDQFIRPKGDSAGEKIAATNNEAQQIIGELNDLNKQYNLGLNRTTDILGAAAAKVADIQANVTKTLQADINTATGKSWINDLQTLVDETKTLQAQSAATNTDPTLIVRRFEVMAQKIVDGAQLTGDAFGELQTLFPDLTGKVHAYTAAVQDNADALKKAADATAKNIVDYLNGLTGGPGSTLAPTAVLSNAQSSYNANYALALGGNADAQAKFVSLADNLEKAARAVYASGQGYQDIRNQIINQGLALPAVQQTTDPVVASLASVLAAIQANGSTQARDATLQGVIKSAIDAGNATAIAALLVPKFDHLDTTADGALNFNEFVAGLGPAYANLTTDPTTAALLTNAQLRAQQLGVVGPLTNDQIAALGLSQEQGNVLNVFRELDGNGNGILEKSEAIKAATQATQNSTGAIVGSADATATNTGGGPPLGHETQWHSQEFGTMTSLLDTSKTLLQTIQSQLVTSSISGGLLGLGNANSPVPNNNNLLTALNKIVYNTAQTAIATSFIAGATTGHTAAYAAGGTIPPFGLGLVSEHLNPTFLRAGPEPIHVFPGAASNDNSALLAEVKRLNDKIDRLERVVAGSGANIARAVVESGEHVADTVETQTDTLAAQERQSNRQRKVA